MSTALVTGGSAGIGLAVVKQLLDERIRGRFARRAAAGLKHKKLKHIEVDLTDTEANSESVVKSIKSRTSPR